MLEARNAVLFRHPGPTPSAPPVLRLTSAAPQRVERRVDLPRLDHRQARRLVVQIPVLLRFCHCECAFGIARNLSRDGVFVETSALPERDACLDLVVPGLALANGASATFPMLIIHRTDRGLGLLFRSLGMHTAAALERLIREAGASLHESSHRVSGVAV